MLTPQGRPTAAEFGQLRAALARMGFKPAQVNAAVGTAVAGRKRSQIAAALREFLRTRGQAGG